MTVDVAALSEGATTSTTEAGTVADPTASRGRGLDAGRDAPIMQAALELVGEVGYDHVTMDAIGRRARASKATIYRRWESKAALVASALSCRHDYPVDLADTGSLRSDLVAGISRFIAVVRAGDLALMSGLLTAMHSDPELARLIREQMVAKKKSVLRALVVRAVARGQLPSDADLGVLDEIAPAIVFTRLILTGEPVGEAFVTHLVDDILLPVLTRPARPDVLERP